MEITNTLKSSDMPSRMPDGTTSNAEVANACIPVGRLPNMAPIFISGVSDTRSFLALLRTFCPGVLMAHLRGESLMFVPSTTDGFTADVSGHYSLDGKDVVSFQILRATSVAETV